jgi:hypothetical protein
MRYRVPVLMLLMLPAMLPVMNVLAAPVPDPSAILDIGPPPKGMTAEEYCKDTNHRLTNPRPYSSYIWFAGGGDPEMDKLPSVGRLKDGFRPWIVKNIRVTSEDGERRLRLTFRAGSRAEQVVIINALLRVYLRGSMEGCIKIQEEALRWQENRIVELEKRIASGQFRDFIDSYRQGINDLRTSRIPATRAEIARLKQNSVIKWAK